MVDISRDPRWGRVSRGVRAKTRSSEVPSPAPWCWGIPGSYEPGRPTESGNDEIMVHAWLLSRCTVPEAGRDYNTVERA